MKMNKRRYFLSGLIATFAVAVTFASTAANPPALPDGVQEDARGEYVILVDVQFKDGEWFVGEKGVEVRPCIPPKRTSFTADRSSLVVVKGMKGEVIYKEFMPLSPRIVLRDEGEAESYLLDEVSFAFRIPLLDGMQRLEFYEEIKGTQEPEGEPSLGVDLSEAIQMFYDRGGPEEKATCQDIEYLPDQGEKRNRP
jgi:hypothetical protein